MNSCYCPKTSIVLVSNKTSTRGSAFAAGFPPCVWVCFPLCVCAGGIPVTGVGSFGLHMGSRTVFPYRSQALVTEGKPQPTRYTSLTMVGQFPVVLLHVCVCVCVYSLKSIPETSFTSTNKHYICQSSFRPKRLTSRTRQDSRVSSLGEPKTSDRCVPRLVPSRCGW